MFSHLLILGRSLSFSVPFAGSVIGALCQLPGEKKYVGQYHWWNNVNPIIIIMASVAALLFTVIIICCIIICICRKRRQQDKCKYIVSNSWVRATTYVHFYCSALGLGQSFCVAACHMKPTPETSSNNAIASVFGFCFPPCLCSLFGVLSGVLDMPKRCFSFHAGL